MLVQMMKAMNRHGCVDSTLTQQVEQLLSDAALQDYTAAFTPGRKTRDYSSEITPGFISKFQYYTNGFTPDQTCSTIPPLVSQQDQNGFTPESAVKCRELKGEKHTFLVATESTTNNNKGCTSEITPAPTGALKKNGNSPAPASPVQEHASVQATPSPVVPALNEGLNTAQVRKYKQINNHFKAYLGLKVVDVNSNKNHDCINVSNNNSYKINIHSII